jgi:hypothetical protein
VSTVAESPLFLLFLTYNSEQERLPFEEGWRPTNRMNAFAFASDILQLALHTPEEAVPVGGTHGFHGFVSL